MSLMVQKSNRMSIQSALLGRLLGLVCTQHNPRRPFTAKENVVLQTTAVATGTMPLAAGFVGIIPALGLLEKSKDGHGPITFGWGKGVLWSLGIVFFGYTSLVTNTMQFLMQICSVFLAVPLRKQTVCDILVYFYQSDVDYITSLDYKGETCLSFWHSDSTTAICPLQGTIAH